MPERSSKKKTHDLEQLAASIVAEATGEALDIGDSELPDKNPHAVALGRLGGVKGGPARALKLSAERRSEIARQAAKARWQRKQGSVVGEINQ